MILSAIARIVMQVYNMIMCLDRGTVNGETVIRVIDRQPLEIAEMIWTDGDHCVHTAENRVQNGKKLKFPVTSF